MSIILKEIKFCFRTLVCGFCSAETNKLSSKPFFITYCDIFKVKEMLASLTEDL